MDKPSLISFFNQCAADWDRYFPVEEETLRCLVSLCDPGPDARVLDAGCGTGALEPLLLAKNPSRLLAVDFSQEMLKIAQSRHPGGGRLEYRCCDIMDLGGEEFDYAILCNTFPYFENRGSLVRQLHHLLAPGGRLLVCHTQGRASVNSHHQANAMRLTLPLPAAKTLTISLNPYFDVDIQVDSPHLYAVSGLRCPL